MTIVRGKIFYDRKIILADATLGAWPWRKCDCGRWIDKSTSQHAETLNLKEMLQRYVVALMPAENET